MKTEAPTREVQAEERLIEFLRLLLSSGTDDAAGTEGAQEGEGTALCPLSEREEGRLYRLAKEQDLAHLILPAAERAGLSLPSPYAEKYQKQMFLALYRDERMSAALDLVGKTLSDASVAHLPLKGALVRTLYPESWQRTSCDMDILVHEEDLDVAARALEAVGYRNGGKEYHDVAMSSADGLSLELHFSIRENIGTIDPVLDRVWEYAAPSEEDSYAYRLRPSFFLFHLIAHMSYHFASGGCGVRPFMDIYLYRNAVSYDETELDALLADAALTKFAAGVFRLSDAWFGGAEPDDLCNEMQAFLFRGGIYGTKVQATQVQCVQKNGRLGYVFHRLFPPMEKLSRRFPVLKKHPWLAPACYVWRILTILFCGDVRKRASRTLRTVHTTSDETLDHTRILLEQLGL